MGSYGLIQLGNKEQLVKTVSLFYSTHTVHTTGEGQQLLHYHVLLLLSDVSSTYKCYKKNPVSIQSSRWRNWNVRLFFIFSPLPSPHQEKAQVFKTIYRSMYKRDGIFFFFFSFFVKTWREKIDKMSTDVFSHSKRTADLVALSVRETKINADV